MPEGSKKRSPLFMTDAELRECCERTAHTTHFWHRDCYEEIQRRSQDRHATAIRRLTYVTVFLAGITALTNIVPLVLEYITATSPAAVP